MKNEYFLNHGKYKSKKSLRLSRLVVFSLVFAFGSLFAQSYAQTNVTGTVTDTSGETLPGVTVLEVGTSNGVITDIDGKYSLSVGSDAVLKFSYIGFREVTLPVNNSSVLDVSLEISVDQLEEVVVIGFGERRRKDLTGSITTVDSKKIEKTSFLSPQFALQGNTPGVRVLNTSGDPNAEAQVQIRGIGTWQGRAQPLYVIDGQVINDQSDFGNQDLIAGNGRETRLNLWNLINPQDIESMTVLKDASAAAIYGSRAANGVILITTRKGRSETPVIEFNAQWGWSTVPTEDRMLNSQGVLALTREARNNSLDPAQSIDFLYGRNEEPADPDDPLERAEALSRQLSNASPQFDPMSIFYIGNEGALPSYNYQDEYLRTALDKTYNVKVSGATDKTDYYVSLGFKDQEHPHVGNSTERFTAAINFNSQIKKWMKAGVNYKFASSSNRVQEQGMEDIVSNLPWQPIFSDDPVNSTDGFAHVIQPFSSNIPAWNEQDIDEWRPHSLWGQGAQTNAAANREYNWRGFELMRNLAQGYLEITPLEGLKIRGSINIDHTVQERTNRDQFFTEIFSPEGQDPEDGADDEGTSGELGSISKRENRFFNYQADLTVSYDRTFGKHSASLVVGAQDTYREQRYSDFGTSNVRAFNPINIDRTGFSNDGPNNSSFLGYGDAFWFGYFARAGYNYDSKYYLDVSFRRDGSSGFDQDFRWGNFYSVAGAWRISSESFMDGVSFINDLKIRGGYGEAGNDELAVGNFDFLSVVNEPGSVRLGSGDGDANGTYFIPAVVNDFPNPELSWETGVTQYVGFDALLLDNKLAVTFEYYDRTTKGILQSVQLAPSLQLGNPTLNLGEVKNTGIDLDLSWSDQLGDFTYQVGVNGSFVNNEVTKLFQDRPLFVDDAFSDRDRRIEIGRSIGHIWGYQVGGIFQDQAEIDAYNERIPSNGVQNNNAFVGPGDIYYLNLGQPTDQSPFYTFSQQDSVLNQADQTELGNTLPDFIYGFNLNLGYKGLDLSVSFYGEQGAQRFNEYRRNLELMDGSFAAALNTTNNRWTEDNINTTMPRAVSGDPANNNLEESSRWVEDASFLRLNNWQLGYTLPQTVLSKLNGNVRSLRVFVGGQNTFTVSNWSGLDPVNDNYPLPRTFLVGLNASF